MARCREESTGLDPFIRKESLAVLAKMGFGKQEPQFGPHRHHGVAARTRLSLAGKRTMATTSQHRHQHHKERATIQQVNELAEIGREIDTFSKAGQRVPTTVWEKYDRVNKRHKKREEMAAIAAAEESRSKTGRKRRAREQREHAAEEGRVGDGHDKMGHPPLRHTALPHNEHAASSTLRPLPNLGNQRAVAAAHPFRGGGGGCTFGSGRGDPHVRETPAASCSTHHNTSPGRSQSCSSSTAWGPHERDKLNEIYWDLGRPPRKGADAAREHFYRYAQRHCMVYPDRSPAEVVERLKLMFRYNALKEPNEREYWLRLNASRGFYSTDATTNGAAPAATGREIQDATATTAAATATAATTSTHEFLANDSSRTDFKNAAADVDTSERPLPNYPSSSSAPLFRRSGGGGSGGDGVYPTGASAAAVSYAAEAIRASSSAASHPRRVHASGATITSPFYDPTRPSSPAWDFGEAPDARPGSRTGSRGSRGSRGGGSRGASAGSVLPVSKTGAGGVGFGAHPDDDGNGPEGTELLDYTSLGPQVPSHRATSPAFAFSRGGLDSENLSMFQADDRQEPGPGSFRPDISVTSTHAGPPCSVVMWPAGSRGGGGGGGEGGGSGGRSGSRGGMGGGGGGLARPGPGQYSAWDSIGRQILSTRPSSPAMTFGTGEWELR